MELFPSKKQNCSKAATRGTSGLHGPSQRKPCVEMKMFTRSTDHWPCATGRWPVTSQRSRSRQGPLSLTRRTAPKVRGVVRAAPSWFSTHAPGPASEGGNVQSRAAGHPPEPMEGAGKLGLQGGVDQDRAGSRGEAGMALFPKGLESRFTLGLGMSGSHSGHHDSAVLERDSGRSGEHGCPTGQAEGPGPTHIRTVAERWVRS